MPLQKSQMHRLMRIAALLKENRYPNSETLVKEFRRIAVEEVVANCSDEPLTFGKLILDSHSFHIGKKTS